VRLAVRSVRLEGAAKTLELYQLGRFGGVVRQGAWRERYLDHESHDSVEDEWVEVELDVQQLLELEAHVRQLAPAGRPGYRGLLIGPERTGDVVEYRPGRRRWFEGDERAPMRATIVDDYMD